MIKKIVFGILAIVVLLAVWQYELIGYGLGQGWGQASVLYKARPLEEFLTDPGFPDSLKQKLVLIQEIRKFAVDSLGINESDSYNTLYDQKGKPILWVVTASDPYKLEAKEWSFPLLGSFSYKGFFDYQKAVKEAQKLKAEGYDTGIDEIAGWSTLGWFNDPILSSMLYRNEGQLANLIIHELTHGTLYVKGNVDYNENLASFVGDQGAQLFLHYKYGPNSKEYQAYENSKYNKEKYTDHILRGGTRLDSLYNTFSTSYSKAQKERLKHNLINSIIASADTLTYKGKRKSISFTEEDEAINNTYFLGFIRYRAQQNQFEEEFKTKFNADFKKYLAYLKNKYSSL